MSSKSSRRQPGNTKNRREVYRDSQDLVAKELASGASAGGLNADGTISAADKREELRLELERAKIELEVTKENNRHREVMTALDKPGGEKQGKGNTEDAGSESRSVSAITILISTPFLMAAALDPLNLFSQEVKKNAVDAIGLIAIGVVASFVKHASQGKRD
jgi:hypothetical protein